MNDDALADPRRPSEDDYFRKHDNQLRKRSSGRNATRHANACQSGSAPRTTHCCEQATATERDRYTQKLLERCTAIAAASGGMLGFGKIRSSEREVLDHIGGVLEQTPHIHDNSTS